MQAILFENARTRAGRTRAQTPALLRGLIFDANGRAMSPSHSRKGQKLYRYYVSQSVIRGGGTTGDRGSVGGNKATRSSQGGAISGNDIGGPLTGSNGIVARIPAGEVEAAVIDQIRALLRSPEVVVATWRSARHEIEGLTEIDVRDALEQFDSLWDELFPAEQARIVTLLVERIDVVDEGIDVRLRIDGLVSVFRDLADPQRRAA